jgi:hypothetical protein
LTPGYIFFYVLFSADTWRILMGIIAAWLLVPSIAPPEMGTGGRTMLYIMSAAIGYAASGVPARGITRILKKRILGGRQS